jgi:hypothetical protein
MIKFKLVSLIILCVLFGCNNANPSSNENQVTNPSVEFKKLNTIMEGIFFKSSQFFDEWANKPFKVNGEKGTILFINPNDLVTENGQPLGKTIQVELKELTNQSDMLKANASTVSNGRLLVSGGAYFIKLTSDNNILKLKEGKSLSVQFPKLTNKEMSLFYGERDSLGQLNWQEANQKFENKAIAKAKPKLDTVSFGSDSFVPFDGTFMDGEDVKDSRTPLTVAEKKLIVENRENAVHAYEIVKVKKLGWINCDRFYESNNNTKLELAFNEKDNIEIANVFLVFQELNSVIQSSYVKIGSNKFTPRFQNIPIGSKTKLIALSTKNGKTYSYNSYITIEANKTIQIDFKETTFNRTLFFERKIWISENSVNC